MKRIPSLTYSDIQKVPTARRKYWLSLEKGLIDKEKEEVAKIQAQQNSSGKGKRTKTISGDGLKQYSGKKF